VREQVYASTRDAWRRQVRRRLQRRQLAVAASVLGLAILGGAAWLVREPGPRPLEVASVESVDGAVQLRVDSGAGTALPLAASRTLHPGEQIETAPGSRLTLRRPGGIRIHVAGGSELAWQTGDALRLTKGLVYVDTGEARAQADDRLAIVTHTGSIRHIGTRFSVQIAALDVRVMVRDGAVAIGNGRAERRVESGHGATLAADGELRPLALAPGEGPWQWLGDGQPKFVIEGRHLDAVLEDLALASGLPLRYGSPLIESSARELVLHGPPLELEPRAAIDTVLLTTQFTRRGPLEIVTRP
jgi:ferric-dicitrate binding protein FerR (iron transport regulator)